MRRSDMFLRSLVMLFIALAAVLFLCDVLMAQEVVKAAEVVAAPASPATPAPAAGSSSALLNPQLWEIIAGIIALIWGFVKVYYKLDEGKKGAAIKIAEKAIKATYDEFVRSAKASHEDGKLTKDEIAHAGKIAWSKAVEMGKTEGVAFATIISEEYMPVVTDKIIAALKK